MMVTHSNVLHNVVQLQLQFVIPSKKKSSESRYYVDKRETKHEISETKLVVGCFPCAASIL